MKNLDIGSQNDTKNNYLDKDSILESVKSGLFGLIVGDALGVPHEFHKRPHFDLNPVTDMVGYGTYKLPPGTWSDDSSLTLATLDSLSNGIDYVDMMNKFLSWYEDAEYTPYNEVFDIGNSTLSAILTYSVTKEPITYSPEGNHDNGNGSLMRILPVAYFIYYLKSNDMFCDKDKLSIVHDISSLTHKHIRSQMACGIYVNIACEILDYIHSSENLSNELNNEYSLEMLIKKGIEISKEYYQSDEDFESELARYDKRIFSQDIKNLSKDDIRGSGYVLNSLEASIWVLLNTNSYKEAVLEAINLGEDTDTTAAIVGGLAGLYYGYGDIPKDWLNQIAKKDYIEELIIKFVDFIDLNL